MALKAGLQNTLGGAFRVGIQVLTIPLLMRLCGAKEYGLWALVSTILAVIGLVEGGFTVATTVFASQDLGRRDYAGFARTLTITGAAMLGLSTVAALVLTFGAAPITNAFDTLEPSQRTAAIVALRYSAIVVWCRFMQQVLISVQQAWQHYGKLNLLMTVQQALANLGMLVIAWQGGRAVAFMAWQALVGVLMLLCQAVVVYRLLQPLRLRPAWDREKGWQIVRYSLLTWSSVLGSMLFSQCDRLLVGALLPTAALGVYAAIMQIAAQINSLSALPVQPLLPIIGEASKNLADRSVELAGRLREALQLSSAIAFGLGAGLVLMAPVVVRFILPESDPEIVTLFRIAITVYMMYSLNAAGYFILLGLGHAGLCMRIVFFSGLASLACIGAGLVSLGLLGAVLGTAGYLATLSLTVAGMRRLGFGTAEWVCWLRAPLVWIAVVLPINWFVPDHLAWQSVVLTLELGILGAWWLRTHRETLERFLRRRTAPPAGG